MDKTVPRVSIGLPVYNGENFLRQALDSLLAQTFTDFELIISDNASIDRTPEICQEYVQRDRRVRYYRNAENLGPACNENIVFQLARGEYFKWAAHDDICHPDFLAKCVEILDRDDSIVLCYSETKIIDKKGNFLAESIEKGDREFITLTNANIKLDIDSPQPEKRFRTITSFPHSCYQLFGLIRQDVLQKAMMMGDYGYAGSDRVLLARLCLFGRLYQIPKCLFFLRRHTEQSISICIRSMHLYTIWWEPTNKGKIVFPRWRVVWETIISIEQIPLSKKDKFACYLQTRYLIQKEWLGMLKDLVIFAIQILDSLYRIIERRVRPSYSITNKKDFILGMIPRLY